MPFEGRSMRTDNYVRLTIVTTPTRKGLARFFRVLPLVWVLPLFSLTGCTNTLTVAVEGNGSGKVTSNPSGIDCGIAGSQCTLTNDQGQTVNLTQTSTTGSVFSGWSGDCSGTGACTVTLDSNRTVFAHFSPIIAVGAYHSCAIR